MNKLKCIIVDDESIARQALRTYVDKTDELECIAEFRNGLEAKTFLQNQTVDLIFLDINMPYLSGLELLKLLPNQPEVIFTTAYAEHAIESFEFNVIDYLLKPYSFERFLQAVQKALRYNQLKKNASEVTLTLKEGNVLVKIKVDDILFIEAMQNYIRISTEAGRHLILMSLKDILEQLGNKSFVQSHRSFIINFDRVDRIDQDVVIIREYRIPISKRNKSAILAKFRGKA